jgi:hypothetical protein
LVKRPEFSALEATDFIDVEPEVAADAPPLAETTIVPSESVTTTPLVSGATPVPKAPSMPKPPVMPSRPAPPKPGPVDRDWKIHTNIKSAVAWIASIAIGFFVGYGLLNISGIPYTREADKINYYFFLALGVSAIVGMKLLFDAMWSEHGRRRALGTSHWSYTSICTFVSLAIIGVEASLGGMALVIYTRKASFENAGEEPFGLMFLLALAVSCANLAYSGFIGFQKGQRSITHEDLVKRAHDIDVAEHEARVKEIQEAHERELALWQREIDRREELKRELHATKIAEITDHRGAHEESLNRWNSTLDKLSGRYEEGVGDRTARMDEFDSFRKLPDFQALCQSMSLVEALNLRIVEVERALTNESISRGHGRKSVI